MMIRQMTEQDLKEISLLEKKLFPDPWSYSSFEYELRNNPYSIPLVLTDDQKIIGYAIIWRIYEEFHIANIAIHPEYQGQKLGTQFFKEILKLRDKCAYAVLEVRESNVRAIHLYQKFGFRIIMKRVHYYKNGETALVMQKIFKDSQVGER
jgi:ribosomal-protein-alanine N-acetyltransferase